MQGYPCCKDLLCTLSFIPQKNNSVSVDQIIALNEIVFVFLLFPPDLWILRYNWYYFTTSHNVTSHHLTF